ncbi:MAG: hypothetical protein ACQEQ5_08730 [Thermodesulfobacteriota bacterium]
MAAASDAPDRFVFDLTNQYRAAPYENAVALGYDPAGLAEKGIFPETRFEPYRVDEGLFSTAADANVRAAAAEPVEPPPDPDRQQMIQTGAVLTFSNFIPMETAGTLFVRNLFTNELDTGEFRFILSSEFKHAGAAMDPGVLDGRNTWFTTLVLGSAARVADIQMLNLINQVRAKPELVEKFVSTDLLNLFQQNWRIYYLPHLRFQPVFFDDLLYECARSDVLTPDDVPDPDQQSMPSLEDVYPGEFFHTTTVAASWENMADAGPVTELFSTLLINEFATWPYDAVIFSNHYKKAGAFVSLIAGEPIDTGPPPGNVVHPGTGTVSVCAGTGVTGSAPETEFARIYGIVFADDNDDAIYAPGEELSGETVAVYDIHRNQVAEVVSDNAGYFTVTLAPGQYWFEALKAEQVVRRFIDIEKNHFVKMGFNPMPLPAIP